MSPLASKDTRIIVVKKKFSFCFAPKFFSGAPDSSGKFCLPNSFADYFAPVNRFDFFK